MIYILWAALIFIIAIFAWFSRKPSLAALGLFLVSFPIFQTLTQIQGNPIACPIEKQRPILGYQLDDEKIYLLLGDTKPIFCVMNYTEDHAKDLTQEMILGPNGEEGGLALGQGQGGEPNIDVIYPEGDYTK